MSGDKPVDLKSITPGEFLFNLYRARIEECVRISDNPGLCVPDAWSLQEAPAKVVWNGAAEDFMTAILFAEPSEE